MGAPPIAPPAPPAAVFPSLTRRPQVRFAFEGISPGAHVYVAEETRLHLQVLFATPSVVMTLNVNVQQLLTTGEVVTIREQAVLAQVQTMQDFFFDLAEGFLLSATVDPTSLGLRRGLLFAQLSLFRGTATDPHDVLVLVSDYLVSEWPLGWPGSPLREPTDGRGFSFVRIGVDPAAGVEIVETVPTETQWMLQGISFTLVTDATAVTREVVLTFDDGANVYARVPDSTGQAAGLTRTYNYGAGGELIVGVVSTGRSFALPRIRQIAGHRFRTVTQNLQAGDNLSAPVYIVEQWLNR